MPPHLVKGTCPSQCTAAVCDDIYNTFAPLYDACTDDTCRAQIQSRYNRKLEHCEDWIIGGGADQ